MSSSFNVVKKEKTEMVQFTTWRTHYHTSYTHKLHSTMAGTFQYEPTNEEKDRGSNFIVAKVRNFFLSLYWAYYIHLPYYLMKNEEAFILHTFFLTLFAFSIYAVFAYLPTSLYHLFSRGYYYLTGDDNTLLIQCGVNQ